jgi:VWFA-related protein
LGVPGGPGAKMTKPRLSTLLVALCLQVSPPSLSAQEEASSVFVERVEVNIVNVEVWVTARNGDQVVGLGPNDFEIFEDGQPVEITNFYAVAREPRPPGILGDQQSPIQEEEQPRSGDESPRATGPVEQAPAKQLNLLVYVDHFNIHPRNRDRVMDDLESFLDQRAAQGDNVMLVSYSNRAIKVIQTFTRDDRLIAIGLGRMREMATYRQVDDAQRVQRMRLMQEAAVDGDLPRAYDFLRSYVEAAHHDLRHSALAVQTVIRSLAGLRGRRAMLYVSDGLPARPGEEMYQYLNDLFPSNQLSGRAPLGRIIDPSIEALTQDESHLFQALTRDANAHQVTLYTLDARGPGGESTLSAEYGRLGFADTTAGRTSLDAVRTQNLQEPLIEMAERTGGVSILNTFSFDRAFDGLARDFESYYSLGYPSRHGGDGRYHSIEVRVKKPDLRVRHRTGFVDKPAAERVADRTLSALLVGFEKNPLGVQIDFGTPEREGKNHYLMPVLVRIPIGRVTLLPGKETHEGQLRIFLVVQDEEGGISKLTELPLPVSIPLDQLARARGKEAGQLITVKVKSGLLTVAVTIWDEISGTDSVLRRKVQVGKVKSGKQTGSH